MDQIASVEKLKKCLDAIKISDTYTDLQNLITELHFAYESYRFKSNVPNLSDQRTLWDTAYYLLTALTNPRRRSRVPAAGVQDGLAISGLVFELLGRYAESQEDVNLQRECFLNAAIANTLSRYEANSAVLARVYFQHDLLPGNKQDYLAKPALYGMNMFLALLAREFFWINRNGPRLLRLFDPLEKVIETLDTIESEYTERAVFWMLTCRAVVQFADFMIGGEERSCRAAMTTLSSARQIARKYELLPEHWRASRLLDCLSQMAEHSTWRVLRAQGFSEEYISTLTRFPWNAVHELWQSQIDALTKVETPGHPEQSNILSNEVKRVVVSMPTSAGKTLIAEMLIVRMLQYKPGSKCVYVASTRALVDEIETKLHRRLRLLGHRVASAVGTFEIGDVEHEILDSIDIAVLTPEKLDYLFRKRDSFIDHIELIIFDEVHKVSEGNRGWLLETLITWLLLKPNLKDVKMIFMSAVLPRSRQPLVRLWIGNQSPVSASSSNWSPTRQLIGILQYEVDWQNPIDMNYKGRRCFTSSANLAYRYDIGDQSRILRNLYHSKLCLDKNDKKVEGETRYDRCLKLIQLLDADRILVYFQEKRDLIQFCKHAQAHLPRVDGPNLERLIEYVSRRLGRSFPLVASLPYGVAFHHGDLPVDVRNEIEDAYRNENEIRVLACTTTLAEGVNLPIQTFILGYHQTWGKHRLSVHNFKNIMGRAGRALVETEGYIFAIQHPEFSKGDEDSQYFTSLTSLDESKLVVVSGFCLKSSQDEEEENRIVGELDALAQSIQDAQSLAQVEYVETLADDLQRLQVFIFTLYEDEIIDRTSETIETALKNTLLFTQLPKDEFKQAVSNLSQRFAMISAKMDKDRLRRFNTSGLRYKSNVALEQLAEQIVERCVDLTPDQYVFESVISRDGLQFILDNIREAQPRQSEYRAKQYKIVESLDHYGVLAAWLGGDSFSSIRDRFFSQADPSQADFRQLRLFDAPPSSSEVSSSKVATATRTCQSYISKQFTFKLPWALAALHTHMEKFGNQNLSFWLESVPAQVKYGVDTPEAVYLSSIGVRSRFLAIALGKLYREEHGAMSDSDWESLGDWFRGLSPFHLRNRVPDLPDLAIRQAIRRANTIRRPSSELRRAGRVTFSIAGWQYYNGEELIDEIREQTLGTEKSSAQLQPEPENMYDEYAVSVYWRGNKLGYVPRTHSEEIAVLLALGRELDARIMTVGSRRPNGRRPVQVWVEIVTNGKIE